MKKLTLDETWKLCLSMWRWIAKQLRANDSLGIEALKKKWLKQHGYRNVQLDCFFCEYAKRGWEEGMGGCGECPGKKVDKLFKCGHADYDWAKRDGGFYNKINSLNKKRLIISRRTYYED